VFEMSWLNELLGVRIENCETSAVPVPSMCNSKSSRISERIDAKSGFWLFYFHLSTHFTDVSSRLGGTRWCSRSWHYTTSWKVAGLIPSEVIRFSNSPNPSSRTVTLGSTQPLTEMSNRNLPGVKERPVGP
jgi:hypothetical protein